MRSNFENVSLHAVIKISAVDWKFWELSFCFDLHQPWNLKIPCPTISRSRYKALLVIQQSNFLIKPAMKFPPFKDQPIRAKPRSSSLINHNLREENGFHAATLQFPRKRRKAFDRKWKRRNGNDTKMINWCHSANSSTGERRRKGLFSPSHGLFLKSIKFQMPFVKLFAQWNMMAIGMNLGDVVEIASRGKSFHLENNYPTFVKWAQF